MHVHLPKPLHGWREFIGEVGIIVVGVLIALGAEQIVEKLGWQERVRQAEASMTKELAEDDGPQAYERLEWSPCIDRELTKTEQALVAERDHNVAFVPPALSTPPFRTWDDNAWRAAVSSQATSHMSAKRMYGWSAPYALISDMDKGAVREWEDWAELDPIGTVSAHPSEAERERMMAAIARAQRDNQFLAFMSKVFLGYSKDYAGVHVSNAALRIAQAQDRGVVKGC